MATSNGYISSQEALTSKPYVKLPEESAEGASVQSRDIHRSGGKIQMRKEIGLLHATTIMAGIMIGSGIFVSPVSITHHCGSIGLSLIIWFLSGILVLFVALSYSEIGTMLPFAGAEYAYYRYTFGGLPAFLYMWLSALVLNPAFYALLALTTSNYMLQPFFMDCHPPAAAVRVFSVWVLVTVAFLNSVYVRYVTRVQTFLTAVKLIALLIIIVSGIVQLRNGNTRILSTGFEDTTSKPGAVAIAVYSGVFTYGGWQYLFQVVEEVKDPNRNVPRATVISFVIVIAVYIMTNVAYFTVLSPEDMMASNAVAVTFAEKTMGKFSLVIPLFVACSTIGALNGSLLGGSRLFFAAGREGMSPSILAMINVHYFTPLPAVILATLITVVYILVGDAVYLLEYLGFLGCFMFLVTIICLLYLRYKQPDKPRPIKVNILIPVSAGVVLFALMVLGLYHEPYKNGVGVLITAAGVPVYWVLVLWKGKPGVYQRYLARFQRNLQKVFLVQPEDR